MRTHVLRVVCDECGKIEQWEILNSSPLTFTLDPGQFLEKAGWVVRKKIGSSYNVIDLCPNCKERR